MKAYAVVARLDSIGFIKSIERGKYLLLGFEPERVLSNPFFISSRVVYPSYVSFWSALNFYGFTEQVPIMVFLASARKKKEVEFNNSRFKYVLINPEKFFGYRKERIGELDFLIAEEEKAVIDSLYLLERFGADAGILLEYSSNEYVKLDPARKKSTVWDKKWHINVNLNEEEIFGWRET